MFISPLKKTHQISRVHLIRELLELEVLQNVSLEPWSKRLAFYGGTALRLSYNSPRYSEDIDLIMLKNIPFHLFRTWAEKLPQALSEETDLEDLHQKRNSFFALLKIKHSELKHRIPIKIELFRKKKGVKFETEPRLLTSPLSSLSPLMLVPTIEALRKMKVDALSERSKPRDLYDLWFLDQLTRKAFEPPKKLPVFQKRNFINELQVYLPKTQYPVIQNLWQYYASTPKKNR